MGARIPKMRSGSKPGLVLQHHYFWEVPLDKENQDIPDLKGRVLDSTSQWEEMPSHVVKCIDKKEVK